MQTTKPVRYWIVKNAHGWTVVDNRTGEAVVLASKVLADLEETEALALAAGLNGLAQVSLSRRIEVDLLGGAPPIRDAEPP